MWPKPYPSSETIYIALCRWLKKKHAREQRALGGAASKPDDAAAGSEDTLQARRRGGEGHRSPKSAT